MILAKTRKKFTLENNKNVVAVDIPAPQLVIDSPESSSLVTTGKNNSRVNLYLQRVCVIRV